MSDLEQTEKLIYEKVIEDAYIRVYEIASNYYTVDTTGLKCEGYYERLSSNSYGVRLDKWYDKNTKRHKGKTNKLYNHTESWFAHIIQLSESKVA